MKVRTFVQSRLTRYVALAAVALALVTTPLFGGMFFRGNNVGGVKVDTEGVLSTFDPVSRQQELQQLRQDVKRPAADLAKPVDLRLVSLRGLDAALTEALANGQGHIPDEVRFLGGLQRIQYVFVYPEENDIILAGPGEGWKVRDDANVVGITTNRPVIQLDDLLVAFRTAKEARRQPISCSIDPSEEGRKSFETLTGKRPQFTPQLLKQLEQAMGPQEITLTGVPADSHLARVLVAADFRMKRIAMHLDPSPVASLPSYLQMLQAAKGGAESATPRWWLACNYEALAKTADDLSWELRGPGVKCMTEDDLVDAQGNVQGAGRKSPIAEKWANKMTELYDELAVKDAVFGELRNVMDLCVVAALIEQQGLLAKAGLELPTLLGSDSKLQPEALVAPKLVDTQCSFLKAGRGTIITASGGVEVTSWEVASQSKIDDKLADVRAKAKAPTGKHWWTN